MKNTLILAALSLLFLCECCYAQDLKYAFTVHVVDENGKPVPGATVEHAFFADSVPMKDQATVQVSDSRGFCSFKGQAYDLGLLRIKKENYYPTTDKPVVYLSQDMNNGWIPMGKTITEVLKPFGTPAPMYAKQEQIVIPDGALNKRLGYDLELGDWVAPYGQGIKPDLIFIAEVNGTDARDVTWKLRLEFSNPGDGILAISSPTGIAEAKFRGSLLRSPTKAPLEGYVGDMEWKYTGGHSPRQDRDHIYIFRVRSILDDKGKIKEASYGKIYNAPFLSRRFKNENNTFKFDGDILWFSYYWNPDKTTNLEFDPERNLSKREAADSVVTSP